MDGQVKETGAFLLFPNEVAMIKSKKKKSKNVS